MRKPSGGSDRPAALLLCPEAPYPTIGGGALRTASILHYLATRYTVDVIAFREEVEPAFPPELVRDVHTIALPRHSRSGPARARRNLGRLVRGAPPLNDRFSGFAGEIAAFLRGRRYELAVVEHFWCAPYLESVAGHARTVLLDLHNIESVLYERAARAGRWPVSAAYRRFAAACTSLERRWLPRYTALLAASEEDAAAARAIAPGAEVHVYPNAIPCRPPPRAAEEDAIVFTGNLAYHPNISAVRWFRREVWPRLREPWPDLRWRIAGKNPQAVAGLVRGDPRIELKGPVEDAVQELARGRAAVVPLLAGSGTRFKILEAWVAGRAVVSTSIGAEGLGARDNEHLLLADDPAGFADAVSRVLKSPTLRRELGAAGRARYEQAFTWEAAWRSLREAGI